MMAKFTVQQCNLGRDIEQRQIIIAENELEAAKAVLGDVDLRAVGRIGELRVRVRPIGEGDREVCFYADAKLHEARREPH